VAQGLLSAKTNSLALIVPDIVNPFFAVVARGAETVARRAGYRLLLCNSEGDLQLEREYVEDMVAHRVEGLIVAPASDRSRENLAPLLRRGFPFVLIDRTVAGLDCDVVQADSVDGARRLTAHLIGVGHRSIAMIAEPDEVSTARERVRGYRAALTAAGISFRPELVVRTASAERPGGRACMNQILGFRPRPSAVVAVNNMTALGAMEALRAHDLTVPKDMALVCFDDVEHHAVLSPFLTVMNQPAETMGTAAAQLLLDRVAGRSRGRHRRVVLASELIVRKSCGAGAATPPAEAAPALGRVTRRARAARPKPAG
jgi:LacI family transcriptional regulator